MPCPPSPTPHTVLACSCSGARVRELEVHASQLTQRLRDATDLLERRGTAERAARDELRRLEAEHSQGANTYLEQVSAWEIWHASVTVVQLDTLRLQIRDAEEALQKRRVLRCVSAATTRAKFLFTRCRFAAAFSRCRSCRQQQYDTVRRQLGITERVSEARASPPLVLIFHLLSLTSYNPLSILSPSSSFTHPSFTGRHGTDSPACIAAVAAAATGPTAFPLPAALPCPSRRAASARAQTQRCPSGRRRRRRQGAA